MSRNLQYRRQFILARNSLAAFNDWQCLSIEQYYLYAHPDLEINQLHDNQKNILLIGCIFDPFENKKNNQDILKDIAEKACSKEELILCLKKYAGRYAIIYKNNSNFIILHDALGLREIYYCSRKNQIICGSQPNLISKFAKPAIQPSSDSDLMDFYKNHLKNSNWVGDETYYEGVKHLLNNHYLDISKLNANRFWPSESIERLSLDEAVSRICTFLKGIMRAMVNRHPVMMAVTSGMDSRALLAASKGLEKEIYFFINNQGQGYKHPDIAIPKRIFESKDIPFHIHNVVKEVDREFRNIFFNNVFLASERVLPAIYNVYYKEHSEKVNILGTGEIGRTNFGKDPKMLDSYRLAYKIGYKKDVPYIFKQSEKILKELMPVSNEFGINLLTLFYLEQNKGNRWVVGNSQSDIAIEEIDPFGSYFLLETFLGVDEVYTKNRKNLIFKEIIHEMWPELMKWPINPPCTMREKTTWLLDAFGFFEPLKELKYQINYAWHRYKTRCNR